MFMHRYTNSICFWFSGYPGAAPTRWQMNTCLANRSSAVFISHSQLLKPGIDPHPEELYQVLKTSNMYCLSLCMPPLQSIRIDLINLLIKQKWAISMKLNTNCQQLSRIDLKKSTQNIFEDEQLYYCIKKLEIKSEITKLAFYKGIIFLIKNSDSIFSIQIQKDFLILLTQKYTNQGYIARSIINIYWKMSNRIRNTLKTVSNRRTPTDFDYQTDQTEGLHRLIKKIKGKTIIESKSNIYDQIKQIPQYNLSLSQMKGDPLELITKLQQKYKGYGAVKIKTCFEWSSPFCFKYSERAITTRIQKIHKLKQGKPFKERIEQHSIKSFNQMAETFQKQYQRRFQLNGRSPQSEMEQQYWNLIKAQSTQSMPQRYKISVQYAADLPVHRHGSGFPLYSSLRSKDQNFDYANSLFNLNNIYKSPKSLLGFTQGTTHHISGVNIPWVYMGMQFSSFCWHVEDLGLNSLNYSHVGAIKTWYVIPACHKEKFDQYVVQKVKNRELLSSITLMVDPIELMQHGISVFKAYQRPKQYILTLFNAYHCGFSQGFNVGEAANVITIDSLEVIRSALLKKEAKKAPVICYEWLIANNIGNKVFKKSQIENEYNRLVNQQKQKLQRYSKTASIASIQIADYSTKYDRMTCNTCKYYQHFSCLKCNQCSKKYCLSHAHQCCGTALVFITRPCDKNRKRILQIASESIK